ncbi:MAG: glycosyltransferase family 2 protein [Bacteroidales bacterium]|nr:glycosyltransferase family 2 protein [Bacteroidales bacterium]
MIRDKKIIVVLPAFNAEKTLENTYNEIPFDIVDEVILVDDKSNDKTVAKAKKLGITQIVLHDENQGYGANQKTCYNEALKLGADIVVMLHPDYQYTPKLIHSMTYLIANEVYPVVLGSRILGKGAKKGGMPFYKFFFNRILTLIQNVLMGARLSEYHTGFRAYSRNVLKRINYEENSNDFVFDNQVIAQIHYAGFEIAEISCPTKYANDSSSINFSRSVKYGLGVLKTSIQFSFQKIGLIKILIFKLN